MKETFSHWTSSGTTRVAGGSKGHVMLSALEPGPRLPECIALHDQRPVGTPLSFMPKTSRNQKSGFESCFIVQTGPFTCLGGGQEGKTFGNHC